MWLLVYVPAVLGVVRYRNWSFWRWVVAMLIWQSAGQFLFAAHGSLEAPERDGLVTHLVREATNDGIWFALFAVVFLALFWGGMIYFLRRLYLAARAPAVEVGAAKSVSKLRKGAELFALTAATAALLYSSLSDLAGRGRSEPPAHAAADSVEAKIDTVIAELKPKLPMREDDITTMVLVSRERRTMIIYHKLEDGGLKRDAISEYLQNQTTAKACASEAIRALLRNGGAVRSTYFMASGKAPLTLDLTAETCAAGPPRS